jgi:hypothetical protein
MTAADTPTTRRRRPPIALAVVMIIIGFVAGFLAAPRSAPSSCHDALNTADSIFTRLGGDLSHGSVTPATEAFVASKTASYKSSRDACESH